MPIANFRWPTAIVVWFALLCALPAYGQDPVVLFEGGQQVKNYNELILKLEPGQRIQFSNGETYLVKEILGHGNTTLIVSNGETARRIPLWRGHRGLAVAEGEPNPYDWSRIRREGGTVPAWHGPDPLEKTELAIGGRFSDGTLDGRFSEIHREFGQSQREMELAGVEVAKIDFTKSVAGEYWEVERVQVIETLDQFIEDMANRSASERELRLEKLLELTGSTFKCETVGDFSPRQIAWTGERWVLLDHRGGVKASISVGGMTAVTHWKRLAPDNKFWVEFAEKADYDIKVRRSQSEGSFTDIQIPLQQMRENANPTARQQSRGGWQQQDPRCQIMSQSFESFLQ